MMGRTPAARRIRTAAALALLVSLALPGAAMAGSKKISAQEWAKSLKPVAVEGANLAVIDIGKGDPVVFLHGTSADYRTWLDQLQPFASRHRVIAYSRRYHFPNSGGGNGRDYSIARHEADLIALLHALDLSRVTLVGHSTGAELAAHMAVDHPEMVKSIVLVEPSFTDLMRGASRGDEYISDERLVTERARQAVNNDFPALGLETEAEWLYGQDALSALVPKSVRQRLADNSGSLKDQLLTRVKSTPFGADQVRTIQCPVLYVTGSKSPWYAQAMADEFVKVLPSTERVTIRNASHGSMWDEPHAFNRAVLAFCAREEIAGE